MICNLTTGYQVPCRQISGVQNIYIAGVDGTFSIAPSLSISNVYVAYQDTIENSTDTYTPGTYNIPLQFLSTDSDLFDDINQDNVITINSWINATITISIGEIPGSGYQPISVSISNIVNNYGLKGIFYITLSDIGAPYNIPYTDNGDPILLGITLTQGDTYQIKQFSRNFYHFTQRLEQGSYIETGIYGENGAIGYNQKLEITLEGYDQSTKNIISLLNKSRLRAIIEDYSGNYHLIGYQNYITSTNADGGLGKTLVDGVKTTLTFEGKELNQAPSVNTSVITQLGLN